MIEVSEVDLCADEVLARQVYEVFCASNRAGRPWVVSSPIDRMLLGAIPNDRHLWVPMVVREGDRVLAAGGPWIDLQANLDKAWLETSVHPGHRRRGTGAVLTRAQEEWSAAHGRTTLIAGSSVPVQSSAPGAGRHPYVAFYEAMGYRLNQLSTVRHCRLPVDAASLDRLDPPEVSPEYDVLTVEGTLPPHLQAGYCDLVNRLGVDAPSGAIEEEPGSLTAQGYVEDMDKDRAAGLTRVTSLAVRRRDGQVVAYTTLQHDGTGVLDQLGTLVRRQDRGHRLGMAVKVANLRAAAQVWPAATRIETVNADVNQWMVAINESLGFETVEHRHELVKVL